MPIPRSLVFIAVLAGAAAAHAQQGGMSMNHARLANPRMISAWPGGVVDESRRGGDPRYQDRLGGTVVLDGNLRPGAVAATYRTIENPAYTTGGATEAFGFETGGVVGPRLPHEEKVGGGAPLDAGVERIAGVARGAPGRARAGLLARREAVRSPMVVAAELFRVHPRPVRPEPLFRYVPDYEVEMPRDPLTEIGWVMPRAQFYAYRGPEVARYGAAWTRPVDAGPAGPAARLGPAAVPAGPAARLGDAPYVPPPLDYLGPAVAPPAAGPAGPADPRAGPDRAPRAPPRAAPARPVTPRSGPDREAIELPRAKPATLQGPPGGG